MIIIIPGWLIAYAIFPGIVMHEIAHKFMCDILQVPVYDVNYFSINNERAGYVYHHPINNITHDLLIAFAPLFINTFFCMIFTLPLLSIGLITGNIFSSLSHLFLYWVGISMGMSAFPSSQDVQNSLTITRKNNGSYIIRFICYFVKACNWIRCAPLDFLYAFLISFILPIIIFKL